MELNTKIKFRKLTQERLKDLLTYCEQNGIFHRLEDKNKIQVDKIHKSSGYTRVQIDGERYVGHRLAWLYCYGYLPEEEIDHIDGNRSNNRLSNLRLASNENTKNARIRNDNRSGVKGVGFHKASGKYRARIQSDGVKYNLGMFESKESAEKAVREKREELHKEFVNHG